MPINKKELKISDDKKEFIEKLKLTKKENTYKSYSRCILKLQEYENDIQKDFINFSLDEHRMFLMLLSNQPTTIRTYLTTLSSFYDFLQEKGIANIGINPIDNLKFNEEIMNICDNKYFYKYVTYEELKIICGMLYNARDKAILLLPWLGLTNDEILSLETNNINFEEKYLTINNKKVEFDEYIGDMLEFTKIEDEYFTQNGGYVLNSSSNLVNNRYISKKLSDSKYLIKGSKNVKCTHNIIHRTFNIIRDFKPNDFNKREELNWNLFMKCKYITPTSIIRSKLFIDLYELEKNFRNDYVGEESKLEKKVNSLIQGELRKQKIEATQALKDYIVFRDRDLKKLD